MLLSNDEYKELIPFLKDDRICYKNKDFILTLDIKRNKFNYVAISHFKQRNISCNYVIFKWGMLFYGDKSSNFQFIKYPENRRIYFSHYKEEFKTLIDIMNYFEKKFLTFESYKDVSIIYNSH